MTRRPPHLAEALLRRLLPPGVVGESILGDLRQELQDRRGRGIALWYWSQTLRLSAAYALRRAGRSFRSLDRELVWAFRLARTNAAFSTGVILLLGLGIGLVTAMFSVVHAVLLRPLPYERPDELVLFWESTPALDAAALSEGNFLDWRERIESAFDGFAGFRSRPVTLTAAREPVALEAMEVSANLFDVLGTPPWLGPGFSPGDDVEGAAPVALLTYGTWRETFGGDEAVIGRAVELDGVSHTVKGVMPPTLEFPPRIWTRGVSRQYEPRIFLPLVASPETRRPFGTLVLARLARGVSVHEAASLCDAIAKELTRANATFFPEDLRVTLAPLGEQAIGSSRLLLWTLFGAVLLVLGVACFNLAVLFLVRASARRREMALRTALGAGRAHLLRQLLVESLVLASLGGGLGLALAHVSLRPLVRFATGHIPRLASVSLDGPVLAFAGVLTVATALLFGLLPAWAGRDARARLPRWPRQAVVVFQVTGAVVLFLAAAFLVQSLRQMQRVELGFDPMGLLSFSVRLPPMSYDADRQRTFIARVEEELAARPEIESAALVTMPPLGGRRIAGTFEIEGRLSTTPEEARARFVNFRQVSPGYFDTMHIPLIRGRPFSQRDREDAMQVAIVDRAVSEKHWPGRSPLGDRVILGTPGSPEAVVARIVAVVENVHYSSLTASRGTVYFPLLQQPSPRLHIVVRNDIGRGIISAAAQSVREAVRRLDPKLAVEPRDYAALLREAEAPGRTPMVLFSIFAVLALLLSAAGLYAVISYTVSRRGREIAVRLALGARRSNVLRLVGGPTAVAVSTGIVLGVASSLFVARVLASMLFRVRTMDPPLLAGVVVLFACVSTLAAYVPTRRALRVDPARALKLD